MLGHIAAALGGPRLPVDETRRPLVLTSALGILLIVGGTLLLAAFAAFLVALTSSGSFALWAIQTLLQLAGA